MTSHLSITPNQQLVIRSETPETLEVEATWAPGGSPPPSHFHPEQDEHFEVLEGRLRVRVEGEDRVLGPGDTLDIPRGEAHQMWNEDADEARAAWHTSPSLRTRAWFEALDGLQRSAGEGSDEPPGPDALAAYLTEYRDVFRLAGS